MTGMPYSMQMVLASVSRSAFLPSFLAWLIIFAVWFNCYSSVSVLVYVMFGGFKNGFVVCCCFCGFLVIFV